MIPLLLFIVMVFSSTAVNANESNVAQIVSKNVSLNVKNKSIGYILSEIQKQTGVGYYVDDSINKELVNLSISKKDATIDDVLTTVLKNTAYKYSIKNNSIVINRKNQTSEIKVIKIISINGSVVDSENKPVIGATIIVDNSGAISDNNGKFFLKAEVGSVLEISFVGMKTKNHAVKQTDENLVIKLEKDIAVIDDVVITGYGTIRKESFTGNSTVITNKDLLKASKTNVLKAIQTFDPSFRIKENNQWGSDPNALPEMYIRGESGIGLKDLDKDPLHKSKLEDNPNLPTFIMDGFEVDATVLYDYDPARIQSVTLLKDAAATALYGLE